jgi:hypothetical protein
MNTPEIKTDDIFSLCLKKNIDSLRALDEKNMEAHNIESEYISIGVNISLWVETISKNKEINQRYPCITDLIEKAVKKDENTLFEKSMDGNVTFTFKLEKQKLRTKQVNNFFATLNENISSIISDPDDNGNSKDKKESIDGVIDEFVEGFFEIFS